MGKDRMHNSQRWSSIRKQSVSGTEYIHYPALCDHLPEGFELYAKTVLNETEENKAEGIQKLKEFVKKEKLVCPDDNHLIMVLRCCKYKIKKSEDKLKRFLKTRHLIAEELAKRDMETIELLMDEMFSSILPYRDRHGRLIFYSRPNLQPEKYEWDDIGYFGLAVVLFCLNFPMTQVYGVTYIGDSSKPSLSVYYPIIKIFKNLTPYVIDIPLRIERVDATNTNVLVRWLTTLLRPILPEKTRKRLAFHGTDFKDLHNFYHKDLVPENVGGTLHLSNKHYREELLNFIEKLRAEN